MNRSLLSAEQLAAGIKVLAKREDLEKVSKRTIIFDSLMKRFPTQKLEDVLIDSFGGAWGGKPDELEQNAPTLRSPDIRGGFIDIENAEIRSFESKDLDRLALKNGDILVIKSNGSFDLVGRSQLFDLNTKYPVTFSNFLMLLRPNQQVIVPGYLDHFLKSAQALSWRLTEQKTTTGLRNLKTKEYLQQVLPVPSKEMQATIVDYLDNATGPANADTQLNLPLKSMQRTSAAAKFSISHDQDLATQSTYLNQLRQAILQEAIEGKLTAEWREKNLSSSPKASARKNPSGLPQASHLPLAGEEKDGSEGSPPAKGEYGEAARGFLSPRDEKDLPAEYYDAAVLLQKIKAEKAALIAAGKLKKEKPLPPIASPERSRGEPGEVPFALPEGWVWTRLGELTESITYGTSQKCSYDSSKNAKVLRIPNVSSGVINDSDLKFTRLSKKEIQELSLKYGDILTIRSNGSPEIVGTMAFVTEAFENYCFAGYLIRLRFHFPLIGHFLSKVSRAKSIRAQIEDPLRTTVGINNINTQELSNLKFPLPPLAEQHAIIERVDKLLTMVDQLEQQVAERKVQAEELMQAVLREAFG